MGNIGPERRRIEVLPIRVPREQPAPARPDPKPAEPAREPVPVK